MILLLEDSRFGSSAAAAGRLDIAVVEIALMRE